MIVGREGGHILLGLMVVIVVTVSLLLSIQGVVSRYIHQERRALAFFKEDVAYVEVILEAAKGVGGRIEKRVLDINAGCRLFGREDLYLNKESGMYEVRLSEGCRKGMERELVGLYYIDSGIKDSRLQYAYDVREIMRSPLLRMMGGEIKAFDGGYQIIIEDSGQRYRYEVSGHSSGSEPFLLQSATSEGFYLVFNGGLWLLPRDARIPVKYIGGFDQEIMKTQIISDLVSLEGVYLLKKLSLDFAQKVSLVIEFYPRGESGLFFGEGRELFRKNLGVVDFQILLVDDLKVLLQLTYADRVQLLSVAWSGETVWGGQYLWQKRPVVDCPLQSEMFEPVAGWVLGCQRKEGILKSVEY